MSDAVARFLGAQGHHVSDKVLTLKGTLEVEGVAEPAFLVLTDRDVLLAAAREDGVGRSVSLGQAHPLAYQSRILGDRLIVGAEVVGVPYGRSREIRRALALGRVRALGAPRAGAVPSGPFIQALDEREAAWAKARTTSDEVLIAWLATATETDFLDPVQSGLTAEWRLVITDQRALLVALSELGDVREEPLPDEALGLREATGRVELQAGTFALRSPLGRDRPFRLLTSLPGLPPDRRLREAARLSWQTRTPEGWAATGRFLEALGEARTALDDVTLGLLDSAEDPLATALTRLRADAADSSGLAELVTRWALEQGEGERLLAPALAAAETPEDAVWTVPLHRAVHDLRTDPSASLVDQTSADLALAEHLVFAGHHDEAAALLELRRAALPDEDLVEVLPPDGADLTRGGGGQPAHIRVLELLVQARGGPDAADVEALAALARHQPLVPQRLEELADHAAGDLSERARRVLELHSGAPPIEPATTPARASLDLDLTETLRHPVERQGGAMGKVQAALAKVVPPDFSEVRSYCARAEETGATELVAAMADASLAMGLPVVAAYISQGEKRLGLRSYEQPEPFVLVGGGHLVEGDPTWLDSAELRFAVGVEVAHLRFGHSRVTSGEVWAGVWDKGVTAISTTATLLPFLKYLPVELVGRERTVRAVQSLVPNAWLESVYGAEAAGELAGHLTHDLGKLGNASGDVLGKAGGALDSAGTLKERLRRDDALPPDLGADAARLVAAHRVMQLTADRAGLVLCGDIGAAVQAIFKTHSRLSVELTVVQRAGLAPALARRDDDGKLRFPHLAVRLAALVAFWLSDDYATLRTAIVGTAAEGNEAG